MTKTILGFQENNRVPVGLNTCTSSLYRHVYFCAGSDLRAGEQHPDRHAVLPREPAVQASHANL